MTADIITKGKQSPESFKESGARNSVADGALHASAGSSKDERPYWTVGRRMRRAMAQYRHLIEE
jgi:hypothetical protein